MSNIREVHSKPRLHVSVKLLFGLWPPCCATPSPSSCVHAYAPTSNTASHDNHEKINSWVSFCFPNGYGAPPGRRNFFRGERGMLEGGGTQFFADQGGFTVPSFRICSDFLSFRDLGWFSAVPSFRICWGVIFRLLGFGMNFLRSSAPSFHLLRFLVIFHRSIISSLGISGDFLPFHHFTVPLFYDFPLPPYHFIIPPFLRLLVARRAPFLHKPRYHKTCLGHCNRTSSLYSL